MSQTAAAAEEEEDNKRIRHSNNNSNNKIRNSSWYPYPYYYSSLDPNMLLGSSLMDIDFTDLDPNSSSWGFDQIQIPSSPLFLPSSSSNDFSLWSFNDSSDQRLHSIPIPPPSDFSRCNNPEPTREKIEQEEEEDDKKKVPNPNPNPNPNPYMGMGFTHTENMEVSFLIKEKMTQALRYLQESSEQNHILAQIWAPIRRGSRVVLTTSGQPFVLGPRSNGLNQYRTVSLMYVFAVDSEVDETLGLPGRVYRQKLPEWTPNVQYYTSKEYSRVDHAKHYNVKGTLALPVFEQSGQSCVGVLELIMTSQKINYAPEVDKVCKALEAVNLKSSEILDQPNIQICNEGRQNALAEILEVLTEICETYKLPLAQTWVPCRHRSVLAYGGGVRKSCSSFDGSCMGQVCMSTTDVAFYVVDAHMWGFREACAEHHLQKGQGVAGRAFLSHGLCFGRDISKFCKIEYPLVHYARLFGLAGSFAICLRSKHTGDDDYVLEFFLPPSVVDIVEQQSLLGSILATMNQDLQNLMVASGRTLEEERQVMEVIEVAMDENLLGSHVDPNLSIKPAPVVENNVNGSLLMAQNSLSNSIPNKDVMKTVGAHVENKEPKKTSERKRGKAEKQISLEVLQQYFAGSLKDAAKSLGVCPTTMKRICRQHGISRWPSRKINKVNRSLTKLKRVIESVQGADGAFTLTTLAPTTMPVVVGSMSLPAGVNGSYQQLSPTDRPDEVGELPKPKVNGKTRNRASSHEERNQEQNELASKEGSGSGEGSSGASTSHGSCHNSPGTESNLANGLYIHNFHEQQSKFTCSELGLLNGGYSKADAFIGGLDVSEAGSSKDLRKLCPLATDANVDEMVGEPSWTNVPYPNRSPGLGAGMTMNMTSSRFAARQDVEMVTIKATFKEDIIRFRFCLASNIVELKEEVAKRLKLEVGTFEIKYLDDDHEWVLIACDSDLQECLELSKTSGTSLVIRLLIHDISSNLGSSCESSGGLEGLNRM